jgi:hypothetical protein
MKKVVDPHRIKGREANRNDDMFCRINDKLEREKDGGTWMPVPAREEGCPRPTYQNGRR